MATLKSIPIHEAKGISNVVDYISNKEKTVVKVPVPTPNETEVNKYTENALSYAEDITKTLFELDGEKSVLVSGYNCNAVSAPEEFTALKLKYEKTLIRRGIDPASRIKGKKAGKGKHEGELVDKEARDAYHFIMSFSERPDLSPQLVHRIGLEFCEKAFPDTKAVVSTHMNTNHLHNHIVRSAYNMSSATKYKDNMDSLKHMREVCNEISLKYGLDILIDDDLYMSREGNSYMEQEQRKNGTSWKQKLQHTIIDCTKRAKSWDEFKRLMEINDYGIKESGKHMVYYNLYDERKRARATTLGVPYTKEYIKDMYGELSEDESQKYAYRKEKANVIEIFDCYVGEYSQKKYNYPKLDLYIPRYTLQGRRRSDLELLFLAAIKVIEYFTNAIDDKKVKTVEYREYHTAFVIEPHYLKIREMQDSLNASVGYGIKTSEELKEVKRDTGAKLNVAEGKLAAAEHDLEILSKISGKIKEMANIKADIRYRGLTDVDIHAITYSDNAIRKNKAGLNPMSAEQKRELYLKLNESEYMVKYKYEYITYEEALKVLKYLNGKSNDVPDVLIKKDDWAAYKASKKKIAPGDSDEVIKKKNDDFEKVLENLSTDDQELLIRYRLLYNELASLGLKDTMPREVLAEKDELLEEISKLKREIADIKLSYRAYANLEKRISQAIDPEYLSIIEYDNIDIVPEELKKKEEQKKDLVLQESTSAVDVVVMPKTNAPNEESEAEKRRKRNRRNIGWGLVDD